MLIILVDLKQYSFPRTKNRCSYADGNILFGLFLMEHFPLYFLTLIVCIIIIYSSGEKRVLMPITTAIAVLFHKENIMRGSTSEKLICIFVNSLLSCLGSSNV